MGGDGPGEPEDRRRGRARTPRLSRLPGTSDATGLERAGRHPLGPDRTRRPLTARLRATAAHGAPGWPTAHFADRTQAVLYSQFWRVDAARTHGISGTGLDWEIDWTAPWKRLVEETRARSLLETSEAPAGDNIFVSPTWIDRTDLYPEK